jgi:hypothetical protein
MAASNPTCQSDCLATLLDARNWLGDRCGEASLYWYRAEWVHDNIETR